MKLTNAEIAEITETLEAGGALPDKWRQRLFPNFKRANDVGKEYRLVYDGKMTREEVLAQTPAAPWQLVRSFCAERPHEDGWRNLLVWGDKPFEGHEIHLWEQYQKFARMYADYGDDATEQAKAIARRIHQVDSSSFKSPWNVHYASHEPERQFSDLLFANGSLFDAFVKMPNTGGYSFPYSYKPARSITTHVANENFNPDFFLKVAGAYDVLVVEVKSEGDDSNRNRAKCRDGLKHFETLNERLAAASEKWRYHFYFLSPEDYSSFFERVRNGSYAGWRSGLMQALADG